MTSSHSSTVVVPRGRSVTSTPVVLAAVALVLATVRADAAVTLGFPGVDGTIRDGILHKPANVHLAVGGGAGAAGRVVMATSAGMQVWDKTGATLDGPVALDAFFGTPVGTVGGTKVIFDEHIGRFFVVGLGGQDANPNAAASAIHVAVSTTAAPMNLAGDWVRLSGDAATTLGGVPTLAVGPIGVGVDANALYVTANLVDAGNVFRGAKIRVFDKSAVSGLLAGTYASADLDVASATTPNPFYLQPARVHGTTDNGHFYIVNRVNGFSQAIGRYRVWEIAGAPAAPVIVANQLGGWQVGSFIAGGGPQAGTTTILDTFATRLLDAVYRDGRLWVVETAERAGTGGIDVEWVELATNGGAPAGITIEDIGAIQGSDGTEWVFNPSITVGAGGDVTICFTQAYYDQFPEMRCARRAASDPASTFQPSFVVAGSVGFYDSTSNPGLGYEVWGLYSGTVVDPDDDATVWSANETVAVSGVDSSIWGTYVARLDAVTPLPPPARGPPVEGGGLVRRAVFSPRLGTPAMRGPQAVAIPADGRHVYVGSAFGTLLGLQRRASDGTLQPVEALAPVGGIDPPNVPQQTLYITFTADGTHMYLADRQGLRVYDRNVTTGLLDVVQVIEGTPFGDHIRSMQIALSPDETNLYVANEAHDSVITYARDVATGELTYLQELVNRTSVGAGGAPIHGLRRAVGVVVSPDGAFVYVLSGSSDGDEGQAIVVFERTPGIGTLNHLESVHQGDGVVGLSFPEAIAISPDGRNLYVTTHDEDLASVWTRDASTGHPTLLEVHGPRTGLANLVGPHGLTVAPDGGRVYVAGTHANTLLVFDRDAATGALAYVGELVEGVTGMSGLVQVSRIAVSADGRSIYTISPGFLKGSSFFEGKSLDLGALVHLERDTCGNGLVSSLEQCDDGNATSGDGCSDACRLELCPPLPRSDCRHPVKARGARLMIKRGATADRNQLQWSWRKGAITTAADLADPAATASYQLCVYRDAPAPELAATLAAPADGICDDAPCWKATNGGAKIVYGDDVATPDGIASMTLKAGLSAGKSSIALKGEGVLLPLPPLPLQLPVTVQLVNGDTGVCWEGRYTTASKNDAERFKAAGE